MRELFRLAIGGYGLFGPIVSVRLRLAPRRKVRREVTLRAVAEVVATLESRADDGRGYGDFQFAIDPAGADFINEGICSCYVAAGDDTPIPDAQRALSRADWEELFLLSHVAPRRATDAYTRHYLATDGQLYWSDLHQMADYHDGYHRALDERSGPGSPGSEMITELYVPRRDLPAFMADVAQDFRTHQTPVIYGTVRLIERDDETVLAWARKPWACVDLQPARRPHASGDRTRRRCLPAPDRPRAGLRRQLLPDLPPLGDEGAGRSRIPTVRRVSAREAALRPRRAFSVRLVPALP